MAKYTVLIGIDCDYQIEADSAEEAEKIAEDAVISWPAPIWVRMGDTAVELSINGEWREGWPYILDADDE